MIRWWWCRRGSAPAALGGTPAGQAERALAARTGVHAPQIDDAEVAQLGRRPRRRSAPARKNRRARGAVSAPLRTGRPRKDTLKNLRRPHADASLRRFYTFQPSG